MEYNADVTADGSGNISHSFNLPDWFVATYKVTATGDQSGTVTTSFTDARLLTSATLNGSSSVNVSSGDSINANVTVQTDGTGANARWRSTGWRIATTAPNATSDVTCVDHTNHDGAGTNSESFSITAPNSNGTYNAYFVAFSDDSCTWNVTSGGTGAGQSNTFTLSNGVVVTPPTRPTNTSLSSSANPSTYGNNVTFTATVTATGGNPSGVGTVDFKDGSTVICDDVALSGNTATCSTSELGAGNHSITAEYSGTSSGSPQFEASTSSALTQTVQKANQAALTVTSPNTGTFGEKLTLSASGGSGTGAVTYEVTGNACELGTGADAGKLLITSGTGTCSVEVKKAGDDNYNAATSGPQTITVNKANQTITFTSTAPTNAVYADTYTPTATGGGSGNPVTFGASGACSYNSSVVTMNSAGSCTVTANQLGNDNYSAASQQQVFSVAKRPANVQYTGDNYVAVASGNATINLSAQVSRLQGTLGNLALANVEFTVKNFGGAVVTTKTAQANASGVAATTASIPTSVDPYTVEVRINPTNSYWTSQGGLTDIGSLTVVVFSGTGRTAGGGWIPDAANAINGKSNFGFTVQTSKTGLKGNSLFIYRLREGSNYVQYVVKSNGWGTGSLGFNVNNDLARATFTTKATVQKYVNGVLVSTLGNYTITVDDLDGDLKNPKVKDGYAIVLSDPSGTIVKQLGTRAAPVALGGGQILIQK